VRLSKAVYGTLGEVPFQKVKKVVCLPVVGGTAENL